MIQNMMRYSMVIVKAMLPAALCLVLTSCAGSLNIKNLAKADIDLVADAQIQEVNSLLRQLTVKLYKRNPRELTKHGPHTLESRLTEIFQVPPDTTFIELNRQLSLEAIRQAFADEYSGDRVFSLIVGLRSMMYRSYNNKTELYMLDTLDHQKLYNSARNLEIVAWRLSNRRSADGQLLLVTNSLTGEASNLSFERLFGKMIALQDMMATIMAQRNQRTINIIVQKIASSFLLPV